MIFDSKHWKVSFSPQLAILWYSIISSVLSACLIAVVVLYIQSQEKEHIDRVTESLANGVKTLLEEDIQKQFTLLSELANLYVTPLSTSSNQIAEEDWNTISHILADTQYDYQAIFLMDSAFKIRKETSIKSKQLNITFDFALNSPGHSTVIKEQLKGKLGFILTLNSNQGDLGLGMFLYIKSLI